MSALDHFSASHFDWQCVAGIGTIRLNRPERKNPLTFESYAELKNLFHYVAQQDTIKTIVILPNGGNFCSGGDVHDIIGPLLDKDTKGLFQFTRLTGDLVKSMLTCGKPIIAAVDGVAVGAGAILAMASDLRIVTPQAKTACLFTRVGLGGCDMGACALLPRIIGQSRAADLLYTGRSMSAEEGERWGFYNRIVEPNELEATANKMASQIARGPSFGHMMTKTQLNHEWNMAPEQAIEAEAQAQALCMQTQDFGRAYQAFINKQQPCFEGD